ncbi:MAG: short-chain fatty acid transporter [Myxococcales bacterium]|nr:short-chain fatty acid transporter [Myxococcales bacterium]
MSGAGAGTREDATLGPIARLGIAARRGFGRLTPEPFVIAVLLTALVAVASFLHLLGDATPAQALRQMTARWHSSGGLWSLLTFAMQASLMLVLGTALAAAPVFRRGLERLATWPKSPRALVGLTAALSIVSALVNWSLGLICGALFARAAGREATRRGWRLHYPLLCAAGYSGLMVWHGGLSGTAPLKATTERDMIEILGPELAARVGTIPLTESVFGGLNLMVSGGLLLLGPLLFALLTPKPGADPDPAPPPASIEDEPRLAEDEAPPADAIERLERSPWITLLLVAPMLGALGLFVAGQGIAGEDVGFSLARWVGAAVYGISKLDLNTVNLALWVAAMILHRRPDRFLKACEEGIRGCAGIFLLFPLYAGIMGLMATSGLSARLAGLFADVGGELFAVLTFLAAGLLNLFVPSGGGQWAIQGPILCESALARGVAPADAMMAMAFGDQWSNMLQPFWAMPLLAITGVRARDIVGYCALWMAAGGLWIVVCLIAMI